MGDDSVVDNTVSPPSASAAPDAVGAAAPEGKSQISAGHDKRHPIYAKVVKKSLRKPNKIQPLQSGGEAKKFLNHLSGAAELASLHEREESRPSRDQLNIEATMNYEKNVQNCQDFHYNSANIIGLASPLPAQGVPLPAQGVPPPAQGVPPPAQGVPLPAQGVPLPAQGVPLSNNTGSMSTSQLKMPISSVKDVNVTMHGGLANLHDSTTAAQKIQKDVKNRGAAGGFSPHPKSELTPDVKENKEGSEKQVTQINACSEVNLSNSHAYHDDLNIHLRAPGSVSKELLSAPAIAEVLEDVDSSPRFGSNSVSQNSFLSSFASPSQDPKKRSINSFSSKRKSKIYCFDAPFPVPSVADAHCVVAGVAVSSDGHTITYGTTNLDLATNDALNTSSETAKSVIDHSGNDESVFSNLEFGETLMGDSQFDETLTANSELDGTLKGNSNLGGTDIDSSLSSDASVMNHLSNGISNDSNSVKRTNPISRHPMYGGDTFVSHHIKKMTGAIPMNDVRLAVNDPVNKADPTLGASIMKKTPTNEMKQLTESDLRANVPGHRVKDVHLTTRSGSEGGNILELSNFKDPLGFKSSMSYAMTNNMIDKTVRFAPDVEAPFERAPKRSKGWNSVKNAFFAKSKTKPTRLQISSPSLITENELLQSSLSKEQLAKLVLPIGTPRTNYKVPRYGSFAETSETESRVVALDKKNSRSYESIRFADDVEVDGEDEDGLYSRINVSSKFADGRPGLVSLFSITGVQAPGHGHLQLPETSQQTKKGHVQILNSKPGENLTNFPVAPSNATIKDDRARPPHFGRGPPVHREKTSAQEEDQISPHSTHAKQSVSDDRISPTSSTETVPVGKDGLTEQDTSQKQTSSRSHFEVSFPTTRTEFVQENFESSSNSGVRFQPSEVSEFSSSTSHSLVPATVVKAENHSERNLRSAALREPENRSDLSQVTEQANDGEKVQSSQASLISAGNQLPHTSLLLSEPEGTKPLSSSSISSPDRKPLSSLSVSPPDGKPLSSLSVSPPDGKSLLRSGEVHAKATSLTGSHRKHYPIVQPILTVQPLSNQKPLPAEEPLPAPQPVPNEKSFPTKQPLLAIEAAPIVQDKSQLLFPIKSETKDDSADSSNLALVKYSGSPKVSSEKQNERKHSVPVLLFKENFKFSPSTKNKIKTDKKGTQSLKKLRENSFEDLTSERVPIYAEVQKSHSKKKSWFGSLSRRFGSKSRLKPEKESLKLLSGKSKNSKNSKENNLDSFNSFVESEEKQDVVGDVPFDAKRFSVHENITAIQPLKSERKTVSMGNVHSVKKDNKTQTHDLPITPTEIYQKRVFESSSSNTKSFTTKNTRQANTGSHQSSLGQKKAVSSSVLPSKSDRFTPRVVGVVLKKGESLDSVIEAQPKSTFNVTSDELSNDPGCRIEDEVFSTGKKTEKLTLKRSKSDGARLMNSSFEPSSPLTTAEKSSLETGVESKSHKTPQDAQETPMSTKKVPVDVQRVFPDVQKILSGRQENILDATKLNSKVPQVAAEDQKQSSDMKQGQDSRLDGVTTFKRRFKDNSFDTFHSKTSPNDTWESISIASDQKTALHKSRSVERPPLVRTHHHVTRSASEPRFRRNKTATPKPSELIHASKMAPILADHMNKHKQIVCEEAGVQLHFQQNQLMANRGLLITDLDDVGFKINGDHQEGKTLRSSISLDSSDSIHQSISRKLSSSSQTSGDRVSVHHRPRSISLEGTDIREYPVSQYRPETEKMIAEAKKRKKQEETKNHQMATLSFDEGRPKGSRLGKSTKGKPTDILIQEAKMGKQDSLPVQKLTSYDIPEQNMKERKHINDVPIREDRLIKNPIYQSISEKDFAVNARSPGTIYTHGSSKPTVSKHDSSASYNNVLNESLNSGHYGHQQERQESAPKVSNENGFSEYVSRGARLPQPGHQTLSRAASSVSQHQCNHPDHQNVSQHRRGHPDHHLPPPSVPAYTGPSILHHGYPPQSTQNVVLLQRVAAERTQHFDMARQYPAASTTHQMLAHNYLAPYPSTVGVPVHTYGYPPHCYVPVIQTHQVTQPVLSSSSLNIYQGQLPPPLQPYDAYYQVQYRAPAPYRPLHPAVYGRYRPGEVNDEPYVGPYYEAQVLKKDRPPASKQRSAQLVYDWASERLAHESPQVQARYRHRGPPIRSGLAGFRPMAPRAQNRLHHPVIIEEIDDKQRQISPLAFSTLKVIRKEGRREGRGKGGKEGRKKERASGISTALKLCGPVSDVNGDTYK
ncbi:hypothetical protein FHG87_023926 [Trinorchestia longiramus]|nr:hypothetical protein FHG87_023926 [Trinorchestia longiramus]